MYVKLYMEKSFKFIVLYIFVYTVYPWSYIWVCKYNNDDDDEDNNDPCYRVDTDFYR